MSMTPFMNLDLPVPGPTGTLGPTWAINLNSALTLVDSHDHTIGKGSPITPASFNINDDLSFNGYSAVDLVSSVYQSQLSVLSTSNAVYVVGGELYYNDGSSTPVQITSGGTINVAGLGAITGDYSSTSANLSYSNTSKTYVFLQGTPNTTATASISAGSLVVNEPVVGGVGITLRVPTGFTGAYSITLPAAPPVSSLPVIMSPTGTLSAAQVTNAQLADNSVSTAKIIDLNVTTAKLANGSVTRVKQESVGQQIGTSGGVISLNGTPQDITAPINISTSGRPVIFALGCPDGQSNYMTIRNAPSSIGVVNISILRDNTSIREYLFQFGASGFEATGVIRIPLNIIDIDPVAASAYNYRVQASCTGTAEVSYGRLIVYEL